MAEICRNDWFPVAVSCREKMEKKVAWLAESAGEFRWGWGWGSRLLLYESADIQQLESFWGQQRIPGNVLIRSRSEAAPKPWEKIGHGLRSNDPRKLDSGVEAREISMRQHWIVTKEWHCSNQYFHRLTPAFALLWDSLAPCISLDERHKVCLGQCSWTANHQKPGTFLVAQLWGDNHSGQVFGRGSMMVAKHCQTFDPWWSLAC